jgi:hypothetical protein
MANSAKVESAAKIIAVRRGFKSSSKSSMALAIAGGKFASPNATSAPDHAGTNTNARNRKPLLKMSIVLRQLPAPRADASPKNVSPSDGDFQPHPLQRLTVSGYEFKTVACYAAWEIKTHDDAK